MLTDFLTPEIKGALSTLGGLAGVESILGAINNKYVRYQSVTIATLAKGFRALAVVTDGVADIFERVQGYGGKIITTIEENNEAGKVDN